MVIPINLNRNKKKTNQLALILSRAKEFSICLQRELIREHLFDLLVGLNAAESSKGNHGGRALDHFLGHSLNVTFGDGLDAVEIVLRLLALTSTEHLSSHVLEQHGPLLQIHEQHRLQLSLSSAQLFL
jgi:hypothetical protein